MVIDPDGHLSSKDGDPEELEILWLITRQPEYLFIEEVPEDYELKSLSELQEYPGKGE